MRCAEGCDTCVDNSPCLYALKLEVRTILLGLTIIITISVVILSLIVALNKKRRVSYIT